MSVSDTKTLIEQGLAKIQAEVPALKHLKLVFELDLRGRGDVQIYRVEVPGPVISKQVPTDAKVILSIPRSHFNELIEDGNLKHWQEAFQLGHAKASGQSQIIQLIEKVTTMQLARDNSRKPRKV